MIVSFCIESCARSPDKAETEKNSHFDLALFAVAAAAHSPFHIYSPTCARHRQRKASGESWLCLLKTIKETNAPNRREWCNLSARTSCWGDSTSMKAMPLLFPVLLSVNKRTCSDTGCWLAAGGTGSYLDSASAMGEEVVGNLLLGGVKGELITAAHGT